MRRYLRSRPRQEGGDSRKMQLPLSKHSVTLDGAARLKDLIYLIILDNKLVKEEVRHARFVGFDDVGLFGVADVNWHAVAVCVARKPAVKMVAVGEDGEVYAYVNQTEFKEVIKPKPICLRRVAVVNGYAVACGMKRQVYRRAGENQWVAMHAPAPKKPRQAAGFEDIDGFSDDEMYAVGWEGEVWEWNGSNWINRASPTNVIFSAVCCAGDGNVYAAGPMGTLLRGRHDRWDLVELEDFEDDFWDLIWFNDQLYLATMTGLYNLIDGDLEPVEFGKDVPKTFYRLTAAEGVLWSVGAKDLFSFNGTRWTRVD
jgi:hypothetical protein